MTRSPGVPYWGTSEVRSVRPEEGQGTWKSSYAGRVRGRTARGVWRTCDGSFSRNSFTVERVRRKELLGERWLVQGKIRGSKIKRDVVIGNRLPEYNEYNYIEQLPQIKVGEKPVEILSNRRLYRRYGMLRDRVVSTRYV